MDPPPPPKYPPKRIVICCDGTWQSSNQGTRSVPSNIAKLSRAISINGKTEKGNWCPQVVWYDAGVGTAMGALEKTYAGAFGEGLSENVCEGYNFLVNNYSPGDELYFFGFSRGAYTARSIAGLVADVGICTNAMMDQFWEMWGAYSYRGHKKLKETEWGQGKTPSEWPSKKKDQKFPGKGQGNLWLQRCQQDFTIEVVGVFDTVGSLGWPNSKVFNYSWSNDDKKYGFHDTHIHPKIKHAFHALALDERRQPFGPTLWNLPKDSKTRLTQCWFPGVHINIGGGQDDGLKDVKEQKGDVESMANITFAWMVDRVRESTMLNFDEAAMGDILRRYTDGLEALIQREVPDAASVYRGWGVGPIVDSFSSQGVLERAIGGEQARTPGQYRPDKNPGEEEAKDGTHPHANTQEYIHPVIAHAKDPAIKREVTYSPEALKGFKREFHEGKGWFWKKEIQPEDPAFYKWSYWTGKMWPTPKGQPQVLTIPEFVMPSEDHFEFSSLERQLILTPPTAPKPDADDKAQKAYKGRTKDAEQAAAFLKRLDRENGTANYKKGACCCWNCMNAEQRSGAQHA